MDKIDQLLDVMEQPENYSSAELEALLHDPEVSDTLTLLAKTKSSLQTIIPPDVNEEWTKFEDKHSDIATVKRFWFTNLFSRNAAAGLTLAIASLTAAAIMGVGILHISHKDTILHNSDTTLANPAIAYQPDTIISVESQEAISPAILVFDNEPLDTIITQIANFYGYKLIFNKDAAKSLRLYFRWNQSQTIDEVIDRLNNFEQISLSVNTDTIEVN